MAIEFSNSEIRRLSEGDAAMAAKLYDAYGSLIFAQSYNVLRRRDMAEEVVQETFLRAWRNAEALWIKKTPLRPWLLRVATNLSIDKLRKRREILMDTLPDLQDTSESAEQTLVRRQKEEILEKAIRKLPDRQLMALTLTWRTGLSNAEAGLTMDISAQAIESLLSRARRKLRDDLYASYQDLRDGANHE